MSLTSNMETNFQRGDGGASCCSCACLLGLLLLPVLIPVSVFALSEGDYTFVTNADGHAIITGFNSSYSGALAIADTLGECPVVAIGDSAFGCCSNLTSLTVPESISYIGNKVFEGCVRLRKVYFLSDAPDVGSDVFNVDCPTTIYFVADKRGWGRQFAGRPTDLWQEFTYTTDSVSVTITGWSRISGTVVIPPTLDGKPVVAVGANAFYGCNFLTNLTVSGCVTSVNGFAFCTGLSRLTLEDGVKVIDSCAFLGCTSLQDLILPNSTQMIGDGAFMDSGLTRVSLGNNLVFIGAYAFSSCSGLGHITIPEDIAYIGNYALAYCENLQGVYFRGNVTFYYTEDVLAGDNQAIVYRQPYTGGWGSAFCGRPFAYWQEFSYEWNSEFVITGYNGPDNVVTIPWTLPGYLVPVTTIGAGAFENRSDFIRVDLPYCVRSIEGSSFRGCSGLEAFTIPLGVTTIGEDAFAGCCALKDLALPDTVSFLGDGAFAACTNLHAVYFEGGPPSIGVDVFDADDAVTLYYSTESSGWTSSFAGRPAMPMHVFTYTVEGATATITGYSGLGGSVPIPSCINGLAVTAIADGAFSRCYSLTNVVFPNSVTSIGSRAFSLCGNLTHINMPSSITLIGAGAFAGCASLSAIVVATNNPFFCSTADGVLFDKFCQTLIQCPGGKAGIYNVPDTVTAIGDYAFENCCRITRVMMPYGLTAIGSRAFAWCETLQEVYARGDCPAAGADVFAGDSPTTVYYQPFCEGWKTAYSQRLTATWQEFEYFDMGDGSLAVDNYTGPGGEAVIPATFQGHPVTEIGYNALKDAYTLTCLNIGACVTSIWDGTFSTCYQLDSIQVASNNSTFASLDGVLFDADRHKLIQYPLGRTGSYTFPDSVVTVGPGSFANSRVSSVMFNIGAKEICENAFCDSALTSVALSSSVTNMCGGAFNNCRSLADVTLQEGLVSIGYAAFFYCEALQHITLPSSLRTLGQEAFSRCRALADITVPVGVTDIGGSAFSMCYGLTAINVADDNVVYSSSNGVFYTKAKDVLLQYPPNKRGTFVVPSSVTTISDSAFAFSCVTSVTIPSNVIKMGSSVFFFCGELTSVTIPSSVQIIPDRTFEQCIRLAGVTIQDGIVSIGAYAFCNCWNLVAISIPDSVTSIGYEAFHFCQRLGTVTLGSGLTSIDCYAFEGCDSLTTITIPKNVTSIGAVAFTCCHSLTAVYFEGDAPNIGSLAFLNTPATFYYLPGRIGWGSPSVCAVPGNPVVSSTFCDGVTYFNVAALVTSLNHFYTGTVSEVDQQVADQFSKADLMGLTCSDLTESNVTNLVADIAITGLHLENGSNLTITFSCHNGITSDAVAVERLLYNSSARRVRLLVMDSLLPDASVTEWVPTFEQNGDMARGACTLPDAPKRFFKLSLQRL